MKLADAVDALASEMPAGEGWGVVVLTHQNDRDPAPGDPILEFPVLGVHVEQGDEEIDLVTNEHGASADDAPGMTLLQLVTELRALVPNCAEYRLFARSARMSVDAMLEHFRRWGSDAAAPPLGEGEHEACLDRPIVGVAPNPGRRVFGFPRSPIEQWRNARG